MKKSNLKRIIILLISQILLLSSLSCQTKRNKSQYLGNKDTVSMYSYDSGKVLIVNPDNIDNALGIKDKGDLVVMDYRDTENPDMKIMSSINVDSIKEMRQVIDALLDYNDAVESKQPWNRSKDSMTIEWKLHNILYELGLFDSHTIDVDFNNNELKNILK